MYMIRTDPSNPRLIEMSFNLSMYQPHLRDGSGRKRDIYQSIFLDDSDTSGWSVGDIDEGKILYKRMTRQFAHKWQHFAYWVPFVRFLQGHRRTFYAGSYCLPPIGSGHRTPSATTSLRRGSTRRRSRSSTGSSRG